MEEQTKDTPEQQDAKGSPDQRKIAELEDELSDAKDDAATWRIRFRSAQAALAHRQEIDGAIIQGLLGERMDLAGRIKRIDLRIAALRKGGLKLHDFLLGSIRREAKDIAETVPDPIPSRETDEEDEITREDAD